jgi:hypothetical protein
MIRLLARAKSSPWRSGGIARTLLVSSGIGEVTGVGVGIRSLLGLLGGVAATAVFLIPATPAGADVVTPPGACSGSGHWNDANFTEDSANHVPSDVIEVPASDTVAWSGKIGDHALGDTGPERNISGEVKLDLPIGDATIDSWGGSSVRYANEGEHSYDLPSVLIGIEMKLHGEHRENGAVVCSGSVFVKVTGSVWSNPLVYGALGLLVISGGMLFFAGRPVFTKIQAYEDENPG